MNPLVRNLSAFVCGLIFAVGLGVGGMTDPRNVVAFLDFAGDWDPALMFVMGGAVLVYALGYRLVVKRPAPLLYAQFALPKARALDGRLLTGAAAFGVGWGLAGLCPGPAITALATGNLGIVVFVASMAAGLWLVPSPKQMPAALPEPVEAAPGASPSAPSAPATELS